MPRHALLKKIFLGPSAIRCAVLVLVMQVIVASSSYWIVEASRTLEPGSARRNLLPLFLIGYLASLLAPYGFGFLAHLALETWRLVAKKTFVAAFVTTHSSGFFEVQGPERERRQAFLVAEEERITDDVTYSCFDALSLFLNVGLNITALALFLEGRFVVAYAAGGLLSAGVVAYSRRRLERSAESSQRSRAKLTSILSTAWENIVLMNVLSHAHWSRRLERAMDYYGKAHAREVVLRNGWSMAGTVCASLPILSFVVWLVVRHSSDTALVAALIATLPRQLQILNHAEALLAAVVRSHGVRAQLSSFLDVLEVPPAPDIASRIIWPRIRLTRRDASPIAASDVQSIVSALNESRAGRLTIRGDNGAGKSTLLRLLKERLGKDAFLLPAQHALAFRRNLSQMSSGERLLAAMTELAQAEGGPRYLLLDEWDANLDAENVERISSLLDALSEGLWIVEIRHRESNLRELSRVQS